MINLVNFILRSSTTVTFAIKNMCLCTVDNLPMNC